MGRHVYDSVYFVFFDPSETRESPPAPLPVCPLLLCSPFLSAAAVKAMPNGLHSTMNCTLPLSVRIKAAPLAAGAIYNTNLNLEFAAVVVVVVVEGAAGPILGGGGNL